MQLSTFSQEKFQAQLAAQNGVFENMEFDFRVELHNNYDFEIVFRNCVFQEEISFVNATFLERFVFNECTAHKDVDMAHAIFKRFASFKDSSFKERLHARRTVFVRNVVFMESTFEGEVFFNHTQFTAEVSFFKTIFDNNVTFHKTYMGHRADFSYASFSRDHTTTFFSLLNSYPRINGNESDFQPPVFIFRYIFFPSNTLFTNVNLSKTLFQDCYIIPIIFKNCVFSKAWGRNCFYQELAKQIDVFTNEHMFERIESGADTLSIRLDDEDRKNLQIGDIVTFVNSSDTTQTYSAFITWIHRAETADLLFERLAQRMPYKDFDHYRALIGRFYTQMQIDQHGLMGFSFKPFDERRHWENLEDVNRQMKRSLEDSRDWQKAGDFYVGEMRAMNRRLKVNNEQRLYRWGMKVYGFVSGYCESVYRILVHMIFSFSISLLILLAFKPELSFAALFDANFKLFIPVFGNNTSTLNALELASWQNVVMEIQVVWFYMIWLFLALTTQRKFKR